MTKRIRLGILTPSSNTVLEPVTQQLIAALPEVSVHFSRFRVTEIAMSPSALGQFHIDDILAAAALLADAKVDMIGWSGTSAGWLGFTTDEALCQRILAATGIPATSSVLGLNRALSQYDVKKLGLVTPYLPNVQEKIIKHYAEIGIDATQESHLSLQDNFSFAQVNQESLEQQIRAIISPDLEAITTFCTNLQAAPYLAQWERQFGIPIFDTVITVLWDMLTTLGVDTRPLNQWGQLMSGRAYASL